MQFLYILKVQFVKSVKLNCCFVLSKLAPVSIELIFSQPTAVCTLNSDIRFFIYFLSVSVVTLPQPECDFRGKYMAENLGRSCGEYVYPVALPAKLTVATFAANALTAGGALLDDGTSDEG